MSQTLALESLVQRGQTPFYTSLVSLYQETQDALRNAPNASHGDVLLTLKSLKFKERIRAIVKKYMGVSLSKVTVESSPVCNFMCVMELTDMEAYQGRKVKDAPGVIMEKINRCYDDKKGYLSTPDKIEALPYKFSFYLYTSTWRLRNTDGSFFFTPEELAAISLHEFGHVDHFIRASLRTYGRAVDASEIVTYVQQYPDKLVISNLITSIRKSRYLSKEDLRLLDVVEKYFTTSNSQDDPYYKEALTALTAIATAESSQYQLFAFSGILGNARDRVASHTQQVDTERSADEFASRNGSYDPLVSALGKIHSLGEDKASTAMKQFMWSGPAFVFGSCVHFLSVFNLRPEEVSQGYDPLIHRLNLIVETAKHAFHDPALPDEVKDNLRGQINSAEAYITHYKAAPHRLFRAAIKNWKDTIVRTGSLTVAPFYTRLSKDYGRLQDETRSLSRNSMYYLSDKLKQ